MNNPTFLDVLQAQRVIKDYLPPTALHHYPALDRLLDARVYVKHENYQPVGAFKVRGGINLVSRLTAVEREQGVITASTGNHGQSIAYAAKLFGVKAVIVAPEGSSRVKVEAMESHGAEVVFHGQDFDDAKDHCEQMARERGLCYISSGDDSYLIAGVGTCALEILEGQPDVEMIFVPIGGGSGAAGTCLVAKTINPDIQVIGVGPAAAPAAYLTWVNREYTTAKMETEADGLATRAPFMLPQRILWQHLDDFVLVEDQAMWGAVRLYLEKAQTLAELSGAAPLAAALGVKERVRDKTIALVLSGGNISPEKLKRCLC
jgi:threonine dehydratase